MLNQARSVFPASAGLSTAPLNLPSYYEIIEANTRIDAQSVILSAASSPPRTPSESSDSFSTTAVSTHKQTSAAAKKKAHKKRKRTGRACVYCQKLHLSCDEQRPCSRCTKAGREDQCRDGKRKRRGRKRKNAPVEDEVEDDECCSDEGHSHSHHHDESDEYSHSADNDDTVSSISTETSFVDKPAKRSKANSTMGFHDNTIDDEAVEAAALLLTFHNITTTPNFRRPVRVF